MQLEILRLICINRIVGIRCSRIRCVLNIVFRLGVIVRITKGYGVVNRLVCIVLLYTEL